MGKKKNHFYCNPTFGRVWGWHSHSWNGDLGVLWDSRNFRVRLQRSKHLALRHSSCHWKLLKCRCWKWPHMSHLDIYSISYGKKKGRESTRPRCVQMECDTLLESSQGELQVCFRPHPNQRSGQRVMNS